jgi:NADH-quinone oxidoreductase subunit E
MVSQIDLDEIDKIIDKYQGEQGVLIQVLLDVQREYNWLPENALRRVSERLGVAFSEVYRVASFYKAMSLTPKGRHLVRVCLGTACHVRGGPKILDKLERLLDIKTGETTQDMKFTLERVNCLGCCALGPVIVVDEEAHGKLTSAKVNEVLDKYD